VTGSPKVKTMEIIAHEEPSPRGVYCGALGYVAPGGDAVFNVAIRTMTLANGEAEFPVGSGVVADSAVGTEYDECLLKARVLSRGALPEFQLLETLLWQPVGGYYLLVRHLERLLDSAAYFDFTVDPVRVRQALSQATARRTEPLRVRLLVSRRGEPTVEVAPLTGATSPFRTVRVARTAVDSNHVFLYHKTTQRSTYVRARTERGVADDVLLFNERGELTESTIANLALCLDGVWYTPPVTSGLLAGVMRAQLLEDGELHERVLTLGDLQRATGLRLLNALRGVFDVKLLE
jgi:para-aminobenzoate synthetase/4-amino-4-deoxychorismate lyase